MTRLKSLFVVAICINLSFGFLPTKLNFDDPDLSDIFCDVIGETADLKAITREGIRREIINLFNEDPPPGSVDFFVPDDATLSEMFHLYYGDDASATRFYKAVNTIAWANADVDSMESTKYDTRYHFDGEQISEGQALLSQRHNLIVSSLISNQSYSFARQQIGFSLHAIQDFYSHTNWYELGNNEILEFLGIPGYTIPNIAEVTDDVCSPCSSEDGSCIGNVITTGKLTSGYYEYDVNAGVPFIVNKPVGGKCSFGGSLDTSRSKTPVGGINKASASACFSPHYYFHTDVVALAEEATQNYLGIIRAAIGNEKFKFLFDLYEGSSLVIVIDTTGSMGGEILAVQQEVAEIVANTPASLYILVPYGDPTIGPMTRTTDSQEFLDAVNRLGPYGGGDQPELVWGALQLALVNTPDYSSLYLFTDAGGKDYQLMNGDFAMAQDKSIICTTIFSYLSAQLVGPPYSDDTDFMNLASVTGGEFISIEDFSIDNVISIIDNGIDSSVVSLVVRRGISGDVRFDAIVDDSVTSLEITISGAVDVASITSPDGEFIDILALTDSTPDITVTAMTPTLIDITVNEPAIGLWDVQVSSSGTFSVTADGASTLGYLVEFTELDTRPPRPNYKLITGQPIQGAVYYVENTLVGWIDNGVISVETMVFLDRMGNVLSQIDNTIAVDDEFYIQTDPIPRENFYVSVNGFLSTGNPFTRLYETLITPSTVGVSVDLAKSFLAAPPDSIVEAVFNVFNYGADATYEYYASDDEGYVQSFTPNVSFIPSLVSDIITVTLYIPPDAIPWTESTIIVTAADESDDLIVNSDLAYFIVLPLVLDTTAPTCVRNDEPDCTGFTSAETCDEGTWTVSATLLDTDSGLSNIYTQPSNNETDLQDPDFVPGSTTAETVTLTASCCITELQIIGVDGQGNIGICNYDLGTIDGVLTFEAIDEGSTWVLLEWTVATVRVDLIKYSVITDFIITNDVVCFETICQYTVNFLSPCSLHEFELIPFFDPEENSNLVAGTSAFTTDRTLDEVPNAPTNGGSTEGPDGSTMIITWDAPLDAQCIVQYEVCYLLAGSIDEGETTVCVTTAGTSIEITDLEPCSLYGVTVVSVTVTGLESDPLVISIASGDAVPGEPTNFLVEAITATAAILTWNEPLINPQCANNYETTWINPDGTVGNDQQKELADELEQFRSGASPLEPCTNYTFEVFAVSPGGLFGPKAVTYGETEELAPSTPSNLVAISTGITSILTSWSSGAGLCVSSFNLCFDDPQFSTQNCTVVDGTSHEIQGLSSCTLYIISVSSFSPMGVESQSVRSAATTNDEVPGSPENLAVTAVTSNSVTIEFDPPLENAQCVDSFETRWVDLDIDGLPRNEEPSIHLKSGRAVNTDTVSGISSCTDVLVMVNFISPQGLISESSNVTTLTAEATPSTPINLQVLAPQLPNELPLRWFSPEDNPRCVSIYNIIFAGNGQTGSSNYPVVAKVQFEFELTLTGLLACTEYTVAVSGITPLGQQGFSSQATGTTLC